MKRRIKKHDLTAWFLEDHATLPASYVKSCQEFFDELKENQNRHMLIAGAVEKRQAASGKRCNLFTTMLEKKTERENQK
jgi:hypothetical protein